MEALCWRLFVSLAYFRKAVIRNFFFLFPLSSSVVEKFRGVLRTPRLIALAVVFAGHPRTLRAPRTPKVSTALTSRNGSQTFMNFCRNGFQENSR